MVHVFSPNPFLFLNPPLPYEESAVAMCSWIFSSFAQGCCYLVISSYIEIQDSLNMLDFGPYGDVHILWYDHFHLGSSYYGTTNIHINVYDHFLCEPSYHGTINIHINVLTKDFIFTLLFEFTRYTLTTYSSVCMCVDWKFYLFEFYLCLLNLKCDYHPDHMHQHFVFGFLLPSLG